MTFPALAEEGACQTAFPLVSGSNQSRVRGQRNLHAQHLEVRINSFFSCFPSTTQKHCWDFPYMKQNPCPNLSYDQRIHIFCVNLTPYSIGP